MNRALFSHLSVGRVTAHVAFWIFVFVAFTSIYSVQSTYLISARNNLFYVPLHIVYFYTVAYWLLPAYLFDARYVTFALYLLAIMLAVAVMSRLTYIWFVSPYLISHSSGINWGYIEESRRTFWQRLTDPVSFINALKAINMVMWFGLVIKLFKLWYERKQAALQAELSALKSQVHPHFLFNTLNNLYALTLNNSPRSPQVVMGLSEMLRYMLYECNADSVPLAKEILMLQQFIDLEKLRYEDRLDLSFNISGDTGQKLIAPLLMLPLVENAFKHGTGESMGDAWINININIAGDNLQLKISNSKPEIDIAKKHEGHIGLENLKKRLNLLYPAAHKLKILDDEDAFLVILEVKLQTQPQATPQMVTA